MNEMNDVTGFGDVVYKNAKNVYEVVEGNVIYASKLELIVRLYRMCNIGFNFHKTIRKSI